MVALPADLDWFAEFSAPSAVVHAAAPEEHPPFASVEVVAPTHAPEVLATPEIRTLFVRDGPNVDARCAVDERGLVAEHEYGILRVSATGTDVTVIPNSPRGARTLLLFTVRELFTSRWVRSGAGLVLHASAAVADGTTFVITGHRLAGKTTLACRIAHGGGALVANDRVAISAAPAVKLYGVPTVVSVRPGTVDLLGLDLPWRAAGWQSFQRLDEVRGRAEPPWPPQSPRPEYAWTLSPAQLGVVLGTEIAKASGKIVLVFPAVDLDDREPPTHRLDPHAVAERLRGQLLGAPGARTSDVLGLSFAAGDPEGTESFLEQTVVDLAAEVSAYHLRLQPGWHRLSLDELLAPITSEDPVS